MRREWPTLVVIVALLAAWWGFQHSDWLLEVLPAHMLRGWRYGARLVPLYADYKPVDLSDAAVRLRVLLALGIVAGLTWFFRRLSRCAWTAKRTSIVLCLITLGVVASCASVALIRGDKALVAPFNRPGLEYFHDTRRVRNDPLAFVRRYHQLSPRLSHHAGTHPPGAVLYLWAVARVVDPSIKSAAWATIVTGALVVLPAYMLARTVMPRSRSLRLSSLMLVIPSVVLFIATSMDAVFLTLTTLALACGVRALRRPGVVRVVLAGASLWLACFFTFASMLVPVMLIWLALLAPSRSRVLTTLAIGATFVVLQGVAHVTVGYDLLAVVSQAMARDHAGLGISGHESIRVWLGLSLANVLAFLIGSGVALSGALLGGRTSHATKAQRRWRSAVVFTIVTMGLSTLFTLETERVWLPMAIAMAVAVVGQRQDRPWIVALLIAQTLATEVFVWVWW